MKLVLAKTLWLFLAFTFTIAEFSVCIGICRESEQLALEILKKEAYDPDNALSSWIVGKDCCKWEGVVCHKPTRRVTGIRIEALTDIVISKLEWLPSLVNLMHLNILRVDLSKATNWLQVINMLPSLVALTLNDCSLQHIPPVLDHHTFSSLKTLHLSYNNFHSPVPKWIFNLSTLVELDLSYCSLRNIPPLLDHHTFPSLETLYLFGNNFTSLVPKWIFNLPSLVNLDLSFNNFLGPFPEGPVNFTSLQTFSGSYNSFNCPLPRWLFDQRNLEVLQLDRSGIGGVVSNLISNFNSITWITLSGNSLCGKLPNVIGKLSKLEGLELSDNLFEGEISESHFTNLTQLTYLDAHGNNLTLKVSQNWIPPFQANTINIGGWNLGPQFPMWLQTQKKIVSLDISNGGIEGEVPVWFWNLTSLAFLYISHNKFVGEVSNISTSIMDLSSNNFSGSLPRISTTVTQLDLSNNSFSGGLSHFLCEIKNEHYELEFLNLGRNNLSGEIPNCWMNCLGLRILILRENNLIGGLPRSIEFLSWLISLDLRKNSLTGPFPSFLVYCTNLRKMDLAENKFVGLLPPWLGIRLSHLIILSLSSNKFHGQLPLELCFLKNLQILDLANNTFSGVIPMCIGNFKAMVTGRKETEVENELYYSFLHSDRRVRENAMITTKGNVYRYDSILALVTNMDMSSNNLSGDIPTSLTILVGLRFCNFSKNHLTGGIPNDIGNMKVLESFDLSGNQLSGKIPQSLASLRFLAYLNISYNNLSGKIPLSTQLQSFNSSSFEGNKKLCGPPLLVNCSFGAPVPSVDENEEESIEDEWDGFYISMAIGFALSFWGVGVTLILKRSWRHVYYRFLDNTWNSLCVKLHI